MLLFTSGRVAPGGLGPLGHSDGCGSLSRTDLGRRAVSFLPSFMLDTWIKMKKTEGRGTACQPRI